MGAVREARDCAPENPLIFRGIPSRRPFNLHDPTPIRPRVPAGFRAGSVVLLVMACGPIVEQAPFFARPDAVEPGDLLGPFEGVVVDADTDRPIADAVVAGSWAFERGVGLQGPAGAFEVTTESGADGRYRLDAVPSLRSGPSMRLRRFTLIVYKKGYVGWRSDHRWDGDVRRDFTQRGQRVRLERWKEGDSHARHLAYLGGGAKVRTASAWELQAASLELDGVKPGTASAGKPGEEAPVSREPQMLDVSALLTESDVRGVTGFAGVLEVERLADLPTTEFYDSRHFKATGLPETWDVALRVWRLGQAAADAQFRKLAAELPGAQPTQELGDASLRAGSGQVAALVFLERERGVVVTITCGTSQCPERAALVKLGKLVEGKLGTLAPAAEPAAPNLSLPETQP